jgi:putative glycosyltransferase (TIGR04372 family)
MTFIILEYRPPHRTLGRLYQSVLEPKILWSSGVQGLLSQALLVMPSLLVARECIKKRDISDSSLLRKSIEAPKGLFKIGMETLRQLGCRSSTLVLLSIHTREYDMSRTPRAIEKDQILESIGTDFPLTIDYLGSHGVDLVRLGGRDTERSRIPREIPRLEDFGKLGGAHEIALANLCTYFWSDEDGGFWTSFPFRKPVLFTNLARLNLNSSSVPEVFVCVPTRYRTPDGVNLTFNEVLSHLSNGIQPWKLAVRGQLQLIRNTPDELMDANREMIARLESTWQVTPEIRILRQRLEHIWEAFPQFHRPEISDTYLLKNQDLLA